MKSFSKNKDPDTADVKNAAVEIAEVLLQKPAGESNEKVPLSDHFHPFYQVSRNDGKHFFFFHF